VYVWSAVTVGVITDLHDNHRYLLVGWKLRL